MGQKGEELLLLSPPSFGLASGGEKGCALVKCSLFFLEKYTLFLLVKPPPSYHKDQERFAVEPWVPAESIICQWAPRIASPNPCSLMCTPERLERQISVHD